MKHDFLQGAPMRGRFRDQTQLFSYISRESRVPAVHPLRKVRALVREVLEAMSRSFNALYAKEGRPSVPPEQLLSALLILALHGIRSERQLMQQLDYNLLNRWFVGLPRTIRCGTRPPSPRTANACRPVRCSSSS
jgi:transposase